MHVLIVGAGIAGPTLAYWLLRAGIEPTLLERAPRLREGGYLIDLWGAGFDVAEAMGIVPGLLEKGYRLRELRELSSDGRHVASVDPRRLTSKPDRYVTVARSDLAATINAALEGKVETILGETVRGIRDDGRRVQVAFADGRTREFDLVVGADGLHSSVRRSVFGPDAEYERDLGIAVAAFDLDGYAPRDEFVAVSHAEVGFQAVRIALRDGTTMFLVTFRHEGAPPEDAAAQQNLLRQSLRRAGGEVPAILAGLPTALTFYFDKASQVRMPSWSRGRVALVGDAAAGPSFLSGQGSALAMVEAYVLAAELGDTGGDHVAAFSGYERRLSSLVRAKQDAAIRFGTVFAPRSRRELLVRNTILRTMGLPFVAKLGAAGRLRDPIRLPPPPRS